MRNFEENVGSSIKVSGRWFDILRYADGRVVEGAHGSIEWPSNQIQNVFANLLAGLCQGHVDAIDGPYLRIGFMAIGHGLVGWDSAPPTLNPNNTTLEDEYFRKVIASPADIYFIDPVTNLPTGNVPSPKIEIAVTLGFAEAIGTMREFGLFGGLATIALDSGEIVNWIFHDKIVKDNSFELERRVRLLFQTT